ncbi:sugar ABC transporter permease, partial [Paenibacillus macerans]|nr:sugar ABC transporter permease [Paenibacillus macerans]
MSELDNPLSLTGSGPSAALTGSKTRAAGRTASIKRQKLRENTLAYAFLAPSLLLFGVFLFYPLLKSVYLSLHSTDPTGRVAAFVGMDNFAGLFSSGLFVNGMK